MNNYPAPAFVPVEVHFKGCRADESLVDLCQHAASELSGGECHWNACVVEVTQRWRRAEIRIALESPGETLAVSRLVPAVDDRQLHRSLELALREFSKLAARPRRNAAPGGRSPRLDPGIPDTPSCIWYG